MFIQESPFKAAYSRNFIYDFTMYVYLLITVYLLFIYDLGIYQCSHNGFLEKRYIVFRKNCVLKNINILLNLRICQT